MVAAMSFRFLVGALFVFGVSLLATESTFAQRVAVMPFAGSQGDSLTAALEDSLLEAGIELVPAVEVSAQVGRDTLLQSDYSEAASALNIQVFLGGRVSRARRQWALRVLVRDAAGDQVDAVVFSGRNLGALRTQVRTQGYTRLEPHLTTLFTGTVEAPVAEEVNIDEETPWYQAEDAGEPETVEDAQNEEAEDDEDEDDADSDYDGLRVVVGFGMSKRWFSADYLVDRETSGAGYTFDGNLTTPETRELTIPGIGHPELHLDLEFFPGALLADPVVPFLGVVFQASYAFGINVQGRGCLAADPERECTAPNQAVELGASQYEIYGGIRFDYDVLAEGKGLFITAELGFGVFAATFDEADVFRLRRDDVIPSMSYRYLNLAAGVRYFVMPDLAIGVHGAYRLVPQLGSTTRDMIGIDSSASGWTVGALFEARLNTVADGFIFRLGVDMVSFSATADGASAYAQGATTGTRESLWEFVRGDSSDRFLRLHLGLGYAI